jgi:hypothetical protein
MMEARYVKVASRFFLAGKAGNAGDGCGGHGHHFLDACFLCKREITSDRHIFMYKYVGGSCLPLTEMIFGQSIDRPACIL